ncbi:MAG: hypothetical protein WC910_10130 [Bacteroidales bacterium]|jgi:hypothetical protein
MAQPLFRRYWIKVHPDGSAFSQFDPFSGKSHESGEDKDPVAQVLFYPVSSGLADKICKQGDKAEPSNLPPLVFDIPIGGGAKLYRVGKLRYDLRQICGICQMEFSPDLEECPRCLAKNQWYCGSCDALKDKPIIDQETNQVRCPDCEATLPRGLRHIECIGEFYQESHYTSYVLEISDRCHSVEYMDIDEGDWKTCIQSQSTQRHLILDYKINRKALA